VKQRYYPTLGSKAFDPHSGSADPSMSSVITFDHDDVVTKPYQQQKRGTISYESGCLTIGLPGPKLTTPIRSSLVTLLDHHDATPTEPVLTDPVRVRPCTAREYLRPEKGLANAEPV
jgi:hypothetical protein